ncbi:hypothetical protein NKK52_18350 [Mesorhizobium sp. C277A]|uniref:hypothetical protein n=1 Tax=unclassified Mesorhizobium TaxID=325217 RepID=UPI0003CEEEEA|nr:MULTISPECIES: hypothetical protein [unclassified Mesorhizobium]ESW67204.1 hypothetical protein X771_15155 [Mesorhizobium sp. LSJC277A00]ESZ50855.1 hypothetical protein X730_05605 [Mesorhizobium sp. L103C565B0]
MPPSERPQTLFACSDCGGERAAAMVTLIETGKLNDIGPQAGLADTLPIGQACITQLMQPDRRPNA